MRTHSSYDNVKFSQAAIGAGAACDAAAVVVVAAFVVVVVVGAAAAAAVVVVVVGVAVVDVGVAWEGFPGRGQR